ncbi:MAG: UDP-3-O-(3-hydroxymyristoyl)glucosamine N-acyltransferase [Hyphomicrobiales bacterium]|nr:UDP-3-O-(3-hydroxymyristoyl)glucosamine N-acyltransferase [Hyphomicrobiales bacterium]
MEHPGFFARGGPFTTGQLAQETGSECVGDANVQVYDAKPLSDAGLGHLSFFDNARYAQQFALTRAAACFTHPKHMAKAPAGLSLLVTKDPYRAFAKALWLLYPDAGRPRAYDGPVQGAEPPSSSAASAPETQSAPIDRDPAPSQGSHIEGAVHWSARLEDGVSVEPGAVIGPEARIGAGTRVAAGAVVGYRCHIGRDCYIGPRAVVTHALIGNGVIIHAGAAIGQDGFGFAMGPGGHFKVPQIGRVIIQDKVEIGANTAIDRGALKDTVIGEGTKIDNLVQIAHNVVIGRHCVIVAQVGIAGSTVLEDFVVMGGQSAIIGHARIGAGAQIAAQSGISSNVPQGARWGGTPAQPLKSWAREVALLKRLAQRKKALDPDGDLNPVDDAAGA